MSSASSSDEEEEEDEAGQAAARAAALAEARRLLRDKPRRRRRHGQLVEDEARRLISHCTVHQVQRCCCKNLACIAWLFGTQRVGYMSRVLTPLLFNDSLQFIGLLCSCRQMHGVRCTRKHALDHAMAQAAK